MLKRITGLVLSMLLVFGTVGDLTYAKTTRVNPSREDLEKRIEEVARRKGIPTVILKSIARVESVFKQYKPDGSVYTGRSGSIGIMQIHNAHGTYDNERLKYDIDYNIEIGADVLLQKWYTANKKLPNIGDMDPNVLENWYFALWAYNSWVPVNNPNVAKARNKKYTYQDLIYKVAEEEYGQRITSIDPGLLPKSGLPSGDLFIETLESYHYGDIVMFDKGDWVKTDVDNSLTLREGPSGNAIGSLGKDVILEVLAEPELKDGYYWYKVREIDGLQEGWVARNWIHRVGDKENGIYPFNDIWLSLDKDYIVELSKKGVITGDNNGSFYPNQHVTREEMSALFSKTLGAESIDLNLRYKDMDEISPWAVEYVKSVALMGLFEAPADGYFRPRNYVTREELAVAASKLLEEKEINPDLTFSDNIFEISPEAFEAILLVCSNGIMSYKENDSFKPKDYITRGEVAKILYLLKYGNEGPENEEIIEIINE